MKPANERLLAQGLRPYGLAGPPPGFVPARFPRRLRNRGRIRFAHRIRPPPLGARMNAPQIIGLGSPLVDLCIQVDDGFLAEHVPGDKGGMEPNCDTHGC